MDERRENILLALKIDEVTYMWLYLGCLPEEGKITLDDGHEVRTLVFNQESFFRDKLDDYVESYESAPGQTPKLSKVSTPYIKESPKENAARRPEDHGGEATMCRHCKHAFAWKRAIQV